MLRKAVLALLVIVIVPLVIPSRASAHHEAVFVPQTVPYQCFTVTRLQPVSHFVLATNGLFVRFAKTEPVQEVQCVPAQIVQPVAVQRVYIIRKNGNGHFWHNGNGHGNGHFWHNGYGYENGYSWHNGYRYGNGFYGHHGYGFYRRFRPAKIIIVRHVRYDEDDEDDD